MPSSVGAEARKLRVEASIKMLGLEKCQHSLIGDRSCFCFGGGGRGWEVGFCVRF